MAVTLAFISLIYYLALTIPAACVIAVMTVYFVVVRFTQIFMMNNTMKKYVIEPSLSKEK